MNRHALNHSFSRTKSRSSCYRVFILCPPKFFFYHLPTSVLWLFFTSSSSVFSNSVAKIYPVTFLHWGLLISSFIVSTFTYSLSKPSRTFIKSTASFSSYSLIYSLMLLSVSLKASSTICNTWSFKFFSSLVRTREMFSLNWSMR